jgi:fibronectin type 3 domain-containing protein
LDISSSSSDNSSSRPTPESGAEQPQGLIANPDPNDTTTGVIVTFTINDPDKADSFILFRATDPKGPFTQVKTEPNKFTTAFIDDGLTPGTTYYYQVAAVLDGKQGPTSDVVSTTTDTVKPPSIGITAPSGLTATSIAQNRVDLSWTDNSTNELGFYLYQSLNGSSFTLIEGLVAGATTASVKGLSQDSNYWYRVQAFATGSTSAFSNTVALRTLPTLPAAPSNLSLLVGGTSQIQVSWTDNSNNEQFFNVFRSTDGVSYPFGITLPAGSTTYLNTGLSAGTTYFYRVNAANTGGTSGFAGPVSATTVPTIPVAPSNLRFTNRTTTRLDLAWNDNSNNESGFLIQSSLTGVTYTNLDTVGANVTDYEVRGLNVGTTYFFQVAAFNAGGTSSFSGATSWQTLPTAPATPTFTSILAGSSSQININWTNVANEIGYNLYRSLNDVSYTGITTLSANVTGFTNSGLSAGTLYFYKIEAFNSGGTSALSGATSATTLAGPTGGTGPTSTNEDGFLIYYRGIT